jgi:hypothetical protein
MSLIYYDIHPAALRNEFSESLYSVIFIILFILYIHVNMFNESW